MPYRIGCYYMSFPTLYKIMEALKMPNPLNYDYTLIEFAINYWLCDNNMDVLVAYIHWKDDGPGMMLVSSLNYIPYGMPDPGDLIENDRDRAIVKEWLVKGAGVKTDELKWITLVDNRRITINGIRRRKVIFERSTTRTPTEILAETMEEGRKRKLDIANDVHANEV